MQTTKSFNDVFDEYYPLMLEVSERVARGHSDVTSPASILASLFVKLKNSPPRPAQFQRAYFKKIALCVLANKFRRLHRQRRLLDGNRLAEEELPDIDAPPDQEASTGDFVERALACLEDDQLKQIAVLRFLFDAKPEDIGAKVDLTKDQVAFRITKIKQQLERFAKHQDGQ